MTADCYHCQQRGFYLGLLNNWFHLLLVLVSDAMHDIALGGPCPSGLNARYEKKITELK